MIEETEGQKKWKTCEWVRYEWVEGTKTRRQQLSTRKKKKKEERETVSRDKPEKHVVASHDIPKALNVLEL